MVGIATPKDAIAAVGKARTVASRKLLGSERADRFACKDESGTHEDWLG